MARYLVKERSFIDNKLVEAGVKIEFDGIPGKNLEPLDKAAKEAAKLAPDAHAESAGRMSQAAAGVDLDEAAKAKAAEEAAKAEKEAAQENAGA